MLKARLVRHAPSHFIETDEGEVHVQFEPCGDWENLLAERVGNKLVVAYLSLDPDPQDPMAEFDGQGNLYTKPSGYARDSVDTDDMSALCEALCVSSDGEVDRELKCTVNGVYQSLAAHAADEFMEANYGHDLTDEWLSDGGAEINKDDEDRSITNRDDIYAELANGEFKEDEIEKIIRDLYSKNWREIVGPYVVPIRYHAERGSTSIGPTSWDGDPDDLPDGVWVADKNCIESIDSSSLPKGVDIRWEGALGSDVEPLHAIVSKDGADMHDAGTESGSWGRALVWARQQYGEPKQANLVAAAERYAASVLSEYESWCNGDVYGCCVETFELVEDTQKEWNSISDDACWGFIGSDYAQQSLLDEFFKPAVEAAAKEAS